MCITLGELKRAAADWCARFDPALVPLDELAEMIQNACDIGKMMTTAATLGAEHRAATGPGSTATRRAIRELAHAAGTSLGEASRAMKAAQQLRDQPEVASAAKAGDLSRQQVALVADAVAANPGAAPRLLALARTGSLQELADESARAIAANQDLEARHNAVHAARSLRPYTDPLGTWHLHAKATPEEGAVVMAAISFFAAKAFELARREGRREAPEAYAFDGLVGLATAGGTQAPKTEIMTRVDLSALLRGYPTDGETCEVAGFGPVSVQAVRDLMESGDPFLKAVVTKGKDVVNVTHLGRRPNAHQKSALDWMFPTCAVEGCGTRATFLQSDHREDWSRTHITVLDLLDRLCKLHHGLKTHQGWALVHGRGKRGFVPPDDPRHPRHART